MPGTWLGALQPLFVFNFHSIGLWLRSDSGLKLLGLEFYSVAGLAVDVLSYLTRVIIAAFCLLLKVK